MKSAKVPFDLYCFVMIVVTKIDGLEKAGMHICKDTFLNAMLLFCFFLGLHSPDGTTYTRIILGFLYGSDFTVPFNDVSVVVLLVFLFCLSTTL